MQLHPLPAFSDNYIWIVHNGQRALVVDPGEAPGVQAWLAREGLQLDTILITHHHPDHVGGVAALRKATGARVIGPAMEKMPEPLQRVRGGDQVQALGLSFEVIDVPGHTAGHVAYYAAALDGTPLVFCGDTLFSGGCGRLFEGTPAQMLQSLRRLAELPDSTRVCCTHEYTLSNLKFARVVEPENGALSRHQQHCEALRARQLPTLPSSIGLEKQINPFLRTQHESVRHAAASRQPDTTHDEVSVFAALREWKNVF
jgi:hydroxyacylglutathione hydrolase